MDFIKVSILILAPAQSSLNHQEMSEQTYLLFGFLYFKVII